MTDNQTNVPPPIPPGYYPQAATGVFGTKIPSSVCFAIGLLLFFLPFAEFRCKPPDEKTHALLDMMNIKITASNTGLGLALGTDWKFNLPQEAGIGGEDNKPKWTKDVKGKEPNTYAIIALGLAALGLGISFANSRSAAAVNIATGLLCSGSLLGLMFDLKKKSGDLIGGFKKTGNSFEVGDYTDVSFSFTPWFFVAVVAFIAAAFFSYKRMRSIKT
jgi:hypothetical protein